MVGAQRQVRQGLGRRFTLRRKTFVERTIKIERRDFANKRNLEGKIQVDRKRPFLAKHEKGGTKRPRGQNIAIPSLVHSKNRVVPKSKRPKAYGFRRVGKAIHGDKRTFIIPGVGIFQRVGRRKRTKIKRLFTFKRSVPIDERLDFVDTVVWWVNHNYNRNFDVELRKALATATLRGGVG